MKRVRRTALALLFVAPVGCRAPAAATPLPTASPTAIPTAASTPPPIPTATLSSDDDFLARPNPPSLRVMTYNVNWDSIFADDDPENHEFRVYNRVASFGRILRAVRPDVLCLQEINDRRPALELGGLLERILSPSGEPAWSVAKVRDNVLAARFPLDVDGYELFSENYPPTLKQASALVDLPDDEYGPADLYLICSHFKAGGGASDIQLRVRQADVIMAQIRDAVTLGGNLDLIGGTPFALVGDFNVYDTDPAQQLATMISGDIQDEGRYGSDFQPDWDRSALTDALPSHNGLGEAFYTWRDDSGSFAPGALDHIVFSDSVLRILNAFILDTTLLGDEALARSGLERDDVFLDAQAGVFDHFPVVVDFATFPLPQP